MSKNERMLIGIAAPTCGGKTTLVGELIRRLGVDVTVLSFDEYDLFPSGSPALAEIMSAGGVTNWEDPALFDYTRYLHDLQRLREGQPVTLLTRSRESLSQGVQTRTLEPGKLTIVEGIFTFSDPRAVPLFDRRFYVDIPASEMVRRRLVRTPDGSPDLWDQRSYIEVEMVAGTEYYVKPQRTRADVVLDGLQPSEQLADQIVRSLT